MRILRQRRCHDGQSVPRPDSESDGRANSAGHVRRALPLPCPPANDARDQTLCAGGESMKPLDTLNALTPDARTAVGKAGMLRRNFMKGTGARSVGLGV